MNNINTSDTPDCYVVLKDSTGITHYVYGILVREDSKVAVVSFLGAPHIFPRADVVIFGMRDIEI